MLLQALTGCLSKATLNVLLEKNGALTLGLANKLMNTLRSYSRDSWFAKNEGYGAGSILAPAFMHLYLIIFLTSYSENGNAPISRIDVPNMLIDCYKLRHYPTDLGTTQKKVLKRCAKPICVIIR